MIEECTIVRVKNGVAYVGLVNKNCGGCKACAFGRTKVTNMPASGGENCKEGDRVRVKMPHADASIALLIYLIPLVMLVAGFLIGGIFGDLYRLLFAFGLLALSIFPCILLEKRVRTMSGFCPQIIEVLAESDSELPR